MRKVFRFGLFLLFIAGQPAIVAAQEEVAEKGMTFVQLLAAGGPVMVPLFICSILAVTFIVYFAFTLREKKIFFAPFISQLESSISKGDINKAINDCKRSKKQVAAFLLGGLEINDQPVEEIRDEMERKGVLIFRDLRNNIEYLSIVGVIAPMLGLLGTVTGMIACFNTIAFKAGLGNPKMLAGGISQALVTTATGLPIGIFALAFYMYFRGKIGRISVLMGDLGERFIKLLKARDKK